MSLFGKPLDDLTEADLRLLVDDGVPERRALEYKRDLPGGGDKGKRELLADVAAMANAEGGHILFGIEDEGGVAVGVPGLETDDVDAEVLRIDGSIRTGIDPRLRNVSWGAVSLENGRWVLVLELPPSYVRPHMVTFKGENRFYLRHDRGKAPMSVDEVRAAFSLTGAALERVRRFRRDRLDLLARGEGPFEMVEGRPLYVLHVLPFSLADPLRSRVFPIIGTPDPRLQPLPEAGREGSAPAYNVRYNFDGVGAFVAAHDRGLTHPPGAVESYTQAFRSGAVEAVRAERVDAGGRKLFRAFRRRHRPVIDPAGMELEVLAVLRRYLGLIVERGVSPPFAVGISLLGAKGHRLQTLGGAHDLLMQVNSDRLVIPEVVIDQYLRGGGNTAKLLAELMRPALDDLWNAAGLSASPLRGGRAGYFGVIPASRSPITPLHLAIERFETSAGLRRVDTTVRRNYSALLEEDYDTALVELDATLDGDPENVDALVLKANYLLQRAEAAEHAAGTLAALRDAEEVVERARGIVPDDEGGRDASYTVWAVAVNAGNDVIHDPDADLAVGVELFELASAVEPDRTEGHYGLGLAHLRRGEPVAALDPLRRAAEIAPDDPGPAVYYGRALLFSDQATEAVEHMENIAARFSGNEDVEVTLLNAYARAGQTDRAIERYETSIKRLPIDPIVRYNYGALLLQAQRYDDAITQLERATELDATNADAFYNLGAAYQNRAASLNEQSGATQDNAEAARLNEQRDENLEAALPYLQRAREVSTGTAGESDACEALFRVYTQLGRISDAEDVSGSDKQWNRTVR